MKKTLLFLCFVSALTFVLFFSGLNLLAMVERVDPIGALASLADDASLDFLEDALGSRGWASSGASGGFGDGGGAGLGDGAGGASPKGSFLDVLRGFKQDAGDPINIVVLSGDKGGNTDAIMVVHVDPISAQVNMLSVPRDTYVNVSGWKNHKVNSVYKAKSGPDLLKKTLADMLGQPIDYYVYIDLATVRTIIDELDGVEYDVPCDLIYDDPDQDLHINIKKGLRTLTGKQVEGLLRFRHPNKWTSEVRKYYDGSDLKRIERQHDFFNEMLKQKLSMKYITKVNGIVSAVYSSIKTDMPLAEMLKVAKCLPSLSQEKHMSAMLPGSAKYVDGVSYYMHSDKQSRALAAAMLADEPPPPGEE